MATAQKKLAATCLDCSETIQIDAKAQVGHKLSCPHCGAYLEIVNLKPLELDWDMGDMDDEGDFDDDLDFDDDQDWDDDEAWEDGDEAWEDDEEWDNSGDDDN